MNVAHNLERSARLFPEHVAIRFEAREITYRELEAEASRAAHGLAGLGVGAGDRVALFLPNLPAFVVAYLAAQKVGAVAVSINALLKAEEIRYLLADCGAVVAFTTADLLPELAPARAALPALREVVVCEGGVPGERTLEALGDASAGRYAAREM